MVGVYQVGVWYWPTILENIAGHRHGGGEGGEIWECDVEIDAKLEATLNVIYPSPNWISVTIPYTNGS